MQSFLFFFNDTATTEIYTLSLHDALPICAGRLRAPSLQFGAYRTAWPRPNPPERPDVRGDRKSTRLNSSHGYISYAVFCLKKKNTATANSRAHHMVCTSHADAESETRHVY